MHIGGPGPTEDHSYTLYGKELHRVTEEKDIGIFIDQDLDFDRHICEKVNKANQMFALIRRTFRYMDFETFIPLYKCLVRTHLDFASSVWSPFKIKHTEQIESVQRRATKQLPGIKNKSYPERLRKFKLPTLSYRTLEGFVVI